MSKTKFIPILFKGQMVRAINANIKKQTRRTRNLENISSMATEVVRSNTWPKAGGWAARFELLNHPGCYEVTNVIKCPYGEVGDILWVRETFISGYKMEDGCFVYDDASEHIPKTWYKADNEYFNWYDGTSDWPSENVPWKPSIHMPFAACRTFLQITDIRVERLNNISDADSIDEGVMTLGDSWVDKQFQEYAKAYRAWDPERHGNEPPIGPTPKQRFIALWESINGLNSFSYNPWVWVVSFKKVDKSDLPL